ncbi:MAG: hypothetical protein P9M15_06380 [Candidatus Electryoneaceae bacterium]|nr:hypothetical protein [Candidatus Electryoneaceae bacterium]
MLNKRKLITFILIVIGIIGFFMYGIMLGDPLDMRIEASGL